MNCDYCGAPLEYEVSSCTRCGAPCQSIPRPQNAENKVVVVTEGNSRKQENQMECPDLSFIQEERKKQENESQTALGILVTVIVIIIVIIALASC